MAWSGERERNIIKEKVNVEETNKQILSAVQQSVEIKNDNNKKNNKKTIRLRFDPQRSVLSKPDER